MRAPGTTAWIATWMLATSSAGCADSGRGADITVVDSAGVRIVINPPGSIAAAVRWRLSPEPVFVIGGGANPDLPLHLVTAVTPLEGGRVAIGTNAPPRGLVVEADGALTATLGGEGDGPGELAGVGALVAPGSDTLAAWDPYRSRISLFTEGGRHLRDVDLGERVPVSPIAAGSSRQPAAFTNLLSSGEGSLVVFVGLVWGSDFAAGVQRLEAPSFRVAADGRGLATYGPFPGPEFYSTPAGLIPYPFGAKTEAAMSGELLVVGTGETPELRLYGPQGALVQIVRWEDRERATDESPLFAEFATWRNARFEGRDPREQAAFRELFDAIPRPERFPAYEGILADSETDEIWVGEYPGQLELIGLSSEVRPMPERRWLVFGADGTLRASLETPERFTPHAAGGGRIWGVFRDPFDAESVRAYEIVRGDGAP